MEGPNDQREPRRTGPIGAPDHADADLLTVAQTYDYLISHGVPRSKKTIRKWCRHNHVDWKEVSVSGGAKWLITRSSLNARIAEERLVDASLARATGPNSFARGRTNPGANFDALGRDDALIIAFQEHLAFERKRRLAAEAKTRDHIDKYHEISLATARMGIELGKGLQGQTRTRHLMVRSSTACARPAGIAKQADSAPSTPAPGGGAAPTKAGLVVNHARDLATRTAPPPYYDRER